MASMLHSWSPHRPAKTPSSPSQMAGTFQSNWPATAPCQRRQGRQLDGHGQREGDHDATFSAQHCSLPNEAEQRLNLWTGKGFGPMYLSTKRFILAHSDKYTSSLFLNTPRKGSLLLCQKPVHCWESLSESFLPDVEQGCMSLSLAYPSLVSPQHSSWNKIGAQ